MTDLKISQLTDGGAMQPGDLIPVARGGANYAVSGGRARLAQYWRVRWFRTVSYQTAGIGEVTFATTAGGPQAATGGTALSSSQNGSGYPASDAFNGAVDAGWFAMTGKAQSEWIAYRFASPIKPAEVRLAVSTDGDGPGGAPSMFGVDFSDDGVAWFNLAMFEPGAWTAGTPKAFGLGL